MENNLSFIIQSNNTCLYPFSPLSKIVPSDKKLLQETVSRIRPHSKNYEDSWGYVIQAIRCEGFKWHDPSTGSLIFFGRKPDETTTLVVPLFFAQPKYLAYVVNIVQSAKNTSRTILKNVNPHDVKNLLTHGFRQYKKNEGWNTTYPFADQTYPQLLIDLKKLKKARGTSYQNLRTALHKTQNFTIRAYQEIDKRAVLEVFASKDENFWFTLNKSKGIIYSSHIMYPTADIDKYVVTENETGKIVGFLATSDISSETTAFVATLFRPGIKHLSIWSIYQTLVKKYEEGFKQANLGGSETIELYNFKREKFRPVEFLAKTHLVYDRR